LTVNTPKYVIHLFERRKKLDQFKTDRTSDFYKPLLDVDTGLISVYQVIVFYTVSTDTSH